MITPDIATGAAPASPERPPNDEYAVSLPDLRTGEAWRQLAACQDMDIAIFYPENASGPGKKTYTLYPPEARDACRSCPVRKACLDFAVNNSEKYGMWGGKTPTERRRMRGVLSNCKACNETYERLRGGLRYCPACRPTLGYI